MILTEKVLLIINKKVKRYYLNLGYDIPKTNNPLIEINVKDLSKGSKIIVSCGCDVCGKINKIPFKSYNYCMIKHNYYTCSGKCSNEKIKKTCKEKYGVEYTFQNDDIKNKIKNTNLKKFGYENPSQNEEIKQKKISSSLKHYGVKYTSQSDNNKNKQKQTNLERYGVEYTFQSEKIKNKITKTNLKRYGVENPTQNYDIFLKSQKSGKHIKMHEIGLNYRGTYEKDFLDFCMNNNIKIEKGKTIKFKYNNKNKYYHSDFYYKPLNLIIEIKSDYYYKKYLNINLSKQKSCLEQEYNFIFVIDKNYEKFKKLI